MDFLVYFAVGLVSGTLAGLFGVGGGLIIVSILVYLFEAFHFAERLVMHLALGTSFAVILLTSVSSARAHHLRSNIDWKTVGILAFPVMAGAFSGSLLAAHLNITWLKTVFAIFVMLVATQLAVGMTISGPKKQLHGRVGSALAGVMIGFISSLVGIGGGTLTVPYLVHCNINIRRAVGTSAAVGFPVALAGMAGYIVTGLNISSLPEWSVGFIYLPAFAGIALASILAAPFGAALAHYLPMHILKRLFALLLYFVALNMLKGILVTA